LPEEARIFSYHGGNVITGIGSFPFTNIDEAIDLIFSVCKEIPFWPQLPKRSYLENMYTTFLEGVPCTVVDTEKNTVFIDTEQVEGIENFTKMSPPTTSMRSGSPTTLRLASTGFSKG